jgi:hypothetical protein
MRRHHSGRFSRQHGSATLTALIVMVLSTLILSGLVWQQHRKRPALPPVQGVICRLAALFETAAVRRFWS